MAYVRVRVMLPGADIVPDVCPFHQANVQVQGLSAASGSVNVPFTVTEPPGRIVVGEVATIVTVGAVLVLGGGGGVVPLAPRLIA